MAFTGKRCMCSPKYPQDTHRIPTDIPWFTQMILPVIVIISYTYVEDMCFMHN